MPVSRRQGPVLGVGAVLVEGARVLLIQRAHAPAKGRWSIPGGKVALGESLADAVVREAFEETGLRVTPGPMVCLYEHVERDARKNVTGHFVVADYLCTVTGGTLRAGSDAAAARWVSVAGARRLRTTAGLLAVMQDALRLARVR